MSASRAAAEKKAPGRVSIVPYLVVSDKGEPWLLGNRCPRCGALYLGARMACSKCSYAGSFEEVKLSKEGKIYVFSVVYQSLPQIRAPYVTCIVDLPEGISVRGTLREIEPDPMNVKFDMPVEMFFEAAGKDDDGNEVISYYFRPKDPKLRTKRAPIMRTAEELTAAKAAKAGKTVPAKAKKFSGRKTAGNKKSAKRVRGKPVSGHPARSIKRAAKKAEAAKKRAKKAPHRRGRR